MDISLFDVVSTTFGVDKSKNKNTDITDIARIGLHGFFSLIFFANESWIPFWIMQDLEHYGARCFQKSSLL